MVSPPFLVANLDATHAHWGCARDPYAEGSMHEWIALFGRMGGNTVVMWCWRCRICYATRRGTRIIAAPGSTVNRKMAWEDYNHLKKFCRTPNCVCRCFVQGRQVCYNRLRLWFGSTANWQRLHDRQTDDKIEAKFASGRNLPRTPGVRTGVVVRYLDR